MLERSRGPDPALGVVPLPVCRAGSISDAKALRGRLQQLLVGVDRADRTLCLLATLARERKIFLLLETPSGAPFESWLQFVTTPQPWGLGLQESMVGQLVEEYRDPKRRARLVLEAPLLLRRQGQRRWDSQTGAPAAEAADGESPEQPTEPAPPKRRTAGRSSGYLYQRLKRDRPDLLQQVAEGTLPSLKAACEVAGLLQRRTAVILEPMCVARLIVSCFDAAGQAEILRLVTHPEEITAPTGNPSPEWKAYEASRTTPEERARREAEREAQRTAHRAAYRQHANAKAREKYAAEAALRTEAKRIEAAALGLPSLVAGWP